MFKKIIEKIKKHWILYSIAFVAIVLSGSAIYYVANGGQQGINNKKVNQVQVKREWKQNNAVNKGKGYGTNIYPVTVVKQAVQKKFGNNFDYVNDFNEINNFIKDKFNKNTAIVFANNTEITNDMTEKEKNSAVGNIKALTTKMYGGMTAKNINSNLNNESCTSTNATVKTGKNMYTENTPKFTRTDKGALVGVPIINANDAGNGYPFYQLTILYSPSQQGDITYKKLFESANDLDISCDNKKINPVFYNLLNSDNYSDNEELVKIKSDIKDHDYQTILAHFSANNPNTQTGLNMSNYDKNEDKKIIGNDFYALTFEIPQSIVNKAGDAGVTIKINGTVFNLFPTNKQNFSWGNYRVIE